MTVKRWVQRLVHGASGSRRRKFRDQPTSAAFAELRDEHRSQGEPWVGDDELTPAQGSVAMDATNRLPALVADRMRDLRAGDQKVVGDFTAVTAAAVRVDNFRQAPGRTELARVGKLMQTEQLDRDSLLRRMVLPKSIRLVVFSLVVAVDAGFFFTLFTDLFQVTPGAVLTLGGLTALALSLLTPMFVVVMAELGGQALARVRAEHRLRLLAGDVSKPRQSPFPALQREAQGARGFVGRASRFADLASRWLWTWLAVGSSLSLSLIFFLIARTRFASESGGDGAVQVPVTLLSLVLAMLPVVALVASAFSHDRLADIRDELTARWEQSEAKLLSLCLALNAARSQLVLSWAAQANRITAIVDESNVAIGLWAQLIMSASAENGSLGTTVPLAARTQPAEVKTQELPTLPSIVQQNPLSKPLPPWVSGALDRHVELLAAHHPSRAEGLDAPATELLQRIRPTDPDVELAMLTPGRNDM